MQKRIDPLIPIMILACLAARLLRIAYPDLAHDEPFTVLQAHRSIAGLFAILPEENNPPLHFLLMHFWVKLVPLDEGWLRVPSAIFSALTIWPLFVLGRALISRTGAIVLSLLFIFSNYHHGFAQEVRVYSLFALLAVTSVWLLNRISIGKSWIPLALVNVLMVYAHFFGWLMIGVQLLMVILVKEWRSSIRSYFIAAGITLLSYIPYFLIFLKRFNTSVAKGTWLTEPDPEELYNMLWDWSNAPVLVVSFLLLIIISLSIRGVRSLAIRIALIWAFVPLFGMFLASYYAPIFLDRYLVYASPGWYLLITAASIQLVPPGRWQLWAPLGIVLLMAFTYKPLSRNWPHPRRVYQHVQQIASPDAAILIHPWWYSHTFTWQFDRQLFKDPEVLERALADRNVHPIGSFDRIEAFGSEHQQVILICHGDKENRDLAEWLKANGYSMASEYPDGLTQVRILEKEVR